MTERDAAFSASLFNTAPAQALRLDPTFRPLALGVRAYRAALGAWGAAEPLAIALEQSPESVATLALEVFPAAAGRGADNLRYVSWMLNGLLWACGGWRITLGGPRELCAAVAAQYGPGGPREFERLIMGQAFGRPLEVVVTVAGAVPPPAQRALALGGHLEGCRLGFDLGASDFKVAAVMDGEVLFSREFPWHPKEAADPAYHYQHLNQGLRLAASFLPRVDAIGGSTAGIVVDNRLRVASLFRAVPPGVFEAEVEPLFLNLQAEWGVPLEVINDGDVTALAGGLALGKAGILGLAMGSSEAVGFLDGAGRITGWLNELAFGPVDAHPLGGRDDWSGNPGTGAAYLSQQALDRLAGPAGLTFAPDLDLPGRLLDLQARMAQGDPAAAEVYATLGAYLGYTLPWYAEFYPLRHAMVLGRVTSGPGGAALLARAQAVLTEQFPKEAAGLDLFLPDEQSRRVGQAVAAASLPPLT